MPPLSAAAVLATLLRYPVVPVFYHPDAAHARRLLQACYAGGIRAIEFTNRGDNALAVFAELLTYVQENCPGLVLGIGTLFTAAQAEKFIAAGAAFVVQPCVTAEVAAVCHAHGVPWLPGALTPPEIYQASQLGAAMVKLFPGSAVGPDYVKALRGPLPHLKLMVTGGVEPTPESIGAWLRAGANAVGLGSQLFNDADDTAALSARINDLLRAVGTLAR